MATGDARKAAQYVFPLWIWRQVWTQATLLKNHCSRYQTSACSEEFILLSEDKREMDYNQRLDEPEAAKVNLGNKGKRFIY